MFTGIVEAVATVEEIILDGANIHYYCSAPFISELKIDQSVAHNGCCLTVVEIADHRYRVTAVKETLAKTNLKTWTVGSKINVERCTVMHGRLDGHIVQGHVDETGTITHIAPQDGSYLLTIAYGEHSPHLTVPQGSITVNGISLTVARSEEANVFSVAIIPYTWEHTNLQYAKLGDQVNLEFDIIGKYVAKLVAKGYARQ